MSLSQNKFEVEQRRNQVASMYLAGLTLEVIAKQLGVSTVQIHKDVKHIKNAWKQTQLETMDESIVKHLAELDYIRQQLRNDYANSKSITTLKELIRVQELMQTP